MCIRDRLGIIIKRTLSWCRHFLVYYQFIFKNGDLGVGKIDYPVQWTWSRFPLDRIPVPAYLCLDPPKRSRTSTNNCPRSCLSPQCQCGEIRGGSYNASVLQPSWSGYSGTVWVSMTWCWHFPHQHGTGEAECMENWHWKKIEESWPGIEGSEVWILARTKSHPLSESGCFLSNRSQRRLGIPQTVKKTKKILSKLYYTYN